MTNLTTSIIICLVTNVHSWTDGKSHTSSEWYYDHVQVAEHPTEGYDIVEVRSNVVAQVVFLGKTNETIMTSYPLTFQRIDWKSQTLRIYETNAVIYAKTNESVLPDFEGKPKLAVNNGFFYLIHDWPVYVTNLYETNR